MDDRERERERDTDRQMNRWIHKDDINIDRGKQIERERHITAAVVHGETCKLSHKVVCTNRKLYGL